MSRIVLGGDGTRPLFVGRLDKGEEDGLYMLLEAGGSLAKRARVILLSNLGYAPAEIIPKVNMHPNSIRKWIHRFKDEGLEALRDRRGRADNRRFKDEARARIADVASRPPAQLGQPYSTWSLRSLRAYLVEEGIVQSISHEALRRILREKGLGWRRSRETFTSDDPDYDFKKRGLRSSARRSRRTG